MQRLLYWGIGIIALLFCVRADTQFADTIFFGGTILTINPPTEVEALAVKDGRILAVGTYASVRNFRGQTTEVINLRGRTLMPGFIDPHVHTVLTVQTSQFSAFVGHYDAEQTVEDVLQILTDALPTVPAGGWLNAFGYDPSRITPLLYSLTKEDLDRVSTTVPIFVLNQSGHIAYVNSLALKIANITDKTPNPPGGSYVRYPNGTLTGQLEEQSAITKVALLMTPIPTLAEFVTNSQKFYMQLAANGITSIADMSTGITLGINAEIAILRQVTSLPGNPIRVRSYLQADLLLDQDNRPMKPTVTPNSGDDVLRFIGVKYIFDGSTQGFTAAVSQPYLNTNNRGTLDNTRILPLDEQVGFYYNEGWQIASHANGDEAIGQVLRVYKRIMNETAKPERRLRIEHFTVNTPALIQEVADLGVIISVTIGHVFYWGHVFYETVLGPARAKRIDPLGALQRKSVRYSMHSDSPITLPRPLEYVRTAVTRIPQVQPPSKLGKRQAIAIDDALRAVTLDAAYFLFMDDIVGSLEVGKYADLVVLGANPRKTSPKDLLDIPILETWLGGVKVYDKANATLSTKQSRTQSKPRSRTQSRK